MNPALHQNAGPAQRNRLFDFLVDDVVGQDVRFRIAFYPVKRAKAAEFFANIRVIDIAVDDIADDVIGMETSPYPICSAGQLQQVRFFKESNRLLRADSQACGRGFQFRADASHKNSGARTDLIAPTSAAFL